MIHNLAINGLALALLLFCAIAIADEPVAAEVDWQDGATVVDSLAGDGVTVHRRENTLWLALDPAAVARQSVAIPRLYAPIHSLKWRADPEHALEFVPEPSRWTFSWKSAPASDPVIEVRFDAPPVPATEAPVIAATGDGSVMLHAHEAEAHGDKLRYEPQPHKNTVGYWTVPTDYAAWHLQIDQPGSFVIAVLQGCGAGQGGSDGRLTLQQDGEVRAELTFQTLDTGHFQNFRWVELGTVPIDHAGRHELRIEPKQIAKAALFDVRAVHLIRQAMSNDRTPRP